MRLSCFPSSSYVPLWCLKVVASQLTVLWYQLWDRKTLQTFQRNVSVFVRAECFSLHQDLCPDENWSIHLKCRQDFPISKLASENSLFPVWGLCEVTTILLPFWQLCASDIVYCTTALIETPVSIMPFTISYSHMTFSQSCRLNKVM